MPNALASKPAFELFFRSNYPRLVGYALKLVNDRDLSEDLVQQTFVNLWEKRDSIEESVNLNSYVLRSVHNACLNHFKHEKVKAEFGNETLQTQSEAFEEGKLEASELQLKVNETIEQLPEQCRRVFLLSRQEGKKYREIADELGISIKTVENQMGKALRLMREGISEHVSDSIRLLSIFFTLLVGVKLFSVVIDKN